jgi:hypothetical protein
MEKVANNASVLSARKTFSAIELIIHLVILAAFSEPHGKVSIPCQEHPTVKIGL